MKKLFLLLFCCIVLSSCSRSLKDRLLSGTMTGDAPLNQALMRSISAVSVMDDSKRALRNTSSSNTGGFSASAPLNLPEGVTGPDDNGWYAIDPRIIGEDLPGTEGLTILFRTSPDMYEETFFDDHFINISSTPFSLACTVKFSGTTPSLTRYDITSAFTQEYRSPVEGSFIDPVTGEPFADYFYSEIAFSADTTSGTITTADGTTYTVSESYDDAVLDIRTDEFDTESGSLKISCSDGYEIDVSYDSNGDGQGSIKLDGSVLGTLYMSYYGEGEDDERVSYYTLSSEDDKIPHTVPIGFIP